MSKQKKAWQVFAKKYNLEYVPGKGMQSPSVAGNIGDHFIALYAIERASGGRGMRGSPDHTTVMELEFTNPIEEIDAVLGTHAIRTEIDTLEELEVVETGDKTIDKETRIRASNAKAFKDYLGKSRMAALRDLLKLSNNPKAVYFKDDFAMIEVQTHNPLDNPAQLEKLYKALLRIRERLS